MNSEVCLIVNDNRKRMRVIARGKEGMLSSSDAGESDWTPETFEMWASRGRQANISLRARTFPPLQTFTSLHHTLAPLACWCLAFSIAYPTVSIDSIIVYALNQRARRQYQAPPRVRASRLPSTSTRHWLSGTRCRRHGTSERRNDAFVFLGQLRLV